MSGVYLSSQARTFKRPFLSITNIKLCVCVWCAYGRRRSVCQPCKTIVFGQFATIKIFGMIYCSGEEGWICIRYEKLARFLLEIGITIKAISSTPDADAAKCLCFESMCAPLLNRFGWSSPFEYTTRPDATTFQRVRTNRTKTQLLPFTVLSRLSYSRAGASTLNHAHAHTYSGSQCV